MDELRRLADALPAPLEPIGYALVAVLAALILHSIGFFIARRAARRTRFVFDDAMVAQTRKPLLVLLPLVALQTTLPSLGLPEHVTDLARHATSILVVLSVAWLIVALTGVADRVVEARWPIDVKDNLQARQIRTQLVVFRRIVITIVSLVALAAILMTFPRVRQLGTSLLASAGIAGLVLGMAARPALGNLIAGVQLALTQPIRIDDVVIVEGEWGWIEEIGSTYVVVKIWDQRRLVVPISYFIEKPFQSWTRTTAELLGTVFLRLDYRAPIEELRAELRRIVESSEKWDGRVCNVQVTGADDRTIEVRALVSAADSPSCWDLRCLVRERLVAYLAEHHPECLPRVRAEIDGGGAQTPSQT